MNIPHKIVSLADQVFERLENEILSGQYARGEILTETRLSDDLGVSRTPIREALRRLEQEHIVEVSTKGIEILGVSEKDLADIYEIRLQIEGIAAARAAEQATPESVAALREAIELQEYYVNRGDAEHIKFTDSQFHEEVYRLSGSMILYDTLLPLHKKVQKYRRASVQNASRAEASLAEHREIFAAIEKKDADAAKAAMIRHVSNAMRHVIKQEGN